MKLFFILSFLFLFNVQALEIQCSSQFSDVQVVVKKSEMSGHIYLLFLNETGVEKYWILEPALTSFDDITFNFQDNDTSIEIDTFERLGLIQATGPLFREQASIPLSNCLKID